MPYQVCLSHINSDYSVDPLPTGSWSAVIDEDDDLIVMLNRVAITSSQNPSHEYPVMDIDAGEIRAIVTVIGGQLYYTDANVPNRSNIKVIAEGALKLLHGSSLEHVQQEEALLRAEQARLENLYRSQRLVPRMRSILLFLLFASLLGLGVFVVDEFNQQPSLVPEYSFVANSIEGMDIRKYTGVYLEGIQEGAQVFELTDDGQFLLYEMWRTTEAGAYRLERIESLPIRLGSHGNRPALMGAEFYLLLPKGDRGILMDGVLFYQHIGGIESLGTLVDASE